MGYQREYMGVEFSQQTDTVSISRASSNLYQQQPTYNTTTTYHTFNNILQLLSDKLRHQAHGVSGEAWRKSRLPGHRQTDHNGVGQSIGCNAGSSGAGENGEREPAQVACCGRQQWRRPFV